MEIIVKELVVIDSIKQNFRFFDNLQNSKHHTIKINGPKESTNGINVAIPRIIKLIIKRFQLGPKRINYIHQTILSLTLSNAKCIK
jgi:hypothetical protein